MRSGGAVRRSGVSHAWSDSSAFKMLPLGFVEHTQTLPHRFDSIRFESIREREREREATEKKAVEKKARLSPEEETGTSSKACDSLPQSPIAWSCSDEFKPLILT